MPLAAGTRLGPYEIAAAIGTGGMGEVYRATDTSLGRQVAIKVLPDVFAQDADRLARFEREAKTLAALNHPNIAQIYGLEKSTGIRALVMELVEGPTLADVIARRAGGPEGPPSRPRARAWTGGPTSGRSGSSCTRCSRDGGCSPERACPRRWPP